LVRWHYFWYLILAGSATVRRYRLDPDASVCIDDAQVGMSPVARSLCRGQ
jgi:hypothetical protein